MSSDPIRRPGQYVTPSPEASAPAPAAPPLVAPPLPSSAPSMEVLDLNSPTDQLAQNYLAQMPEASTPEERAKQIQSAREQAKAFLDLPPAERWLRNIKKAKMTEDEANAVLDSILSQGYWEKTYALYGGRLKIVLRSRDFSANQRVAAALDNVRSYDPTVINQVRLRTQLACSLVEYKGQRLDIADPDAHITMQDEAYAARLRFCDMRIPGAAAEAVYAALIDFDARTYAAMSEGASSAF